MILLLIWYYFNFIFEQFESFYLSVVGVYMYKEEI